MAKLYAVLLFFLIAFLSVESIRIDPPQIRSGGKLFAESNVPNVIPNDPRCTRNGVFGNSNDCSSYYVCRDGTGQNRKCPDGMKFHRIKHCTLDEVDCSLLQNSENARKDFECPDDYGMYPFPTDCHKYVVCFEALPFIYTCPPDQIYQDNVGCVDGSVCPQQTQVTIISDSILDSGEDEKCLLPPESGPCGAKIPRFFYDINIGQCKQFTYGGCQGNGNNFKTKRECEVACLTRLPTQISEKSRSCISSDSVIANRFTCSRYTQCVNFIPTTVICSKGEGFSSKRKRCVKFEESDCRSNSVLNILED